MADQPANEESALVKFFILPQRIIVSIMGFLCTVFAYTMRVCLSVAITRMVVLKNQTDDGSSAMCEPDPDYQKDVPTSYGLYDWSEQMQGLILSCFYITYIITHLPGGLLAEKFGAKWTLTVCIIINIILSALTPLSIKTGGANGLIIIRLLMGLAQGPIFPAISVLIVQWVPMKERGALGTLMLGGDQFGTFLANSLSGVIMDNYDWPNVFYFFALLSCIWVLLFIVLCYSDPSLHPFLSAKEREYLIAEMGSIEQKREMPPVPWKMIFTNVPLLALILAQMGHDWSFYIMITDLPKYMSDVMRVSILQNGLYSSLPYIAMWVFSLTSGIISDLLVRKNILALLTARKITGAICTFGPSIFMVAASYAGCNVLMVVICFVLTMGFMGAYYCGMKLSTMDLSPNYAGTLMAIVNGLGAFNGFFAPYSVGAMTPNANLTEWRRVFWLAFFVKVITGLIYIIFIKGDPQPFNEPDKVANN